MCLWWFCLSNKGYGYDYVEAFRFDIQFGARCWGGFYFLFFI